jgi:hypothetical protein
MKLVRPATWAAVGALVVLTARALAYALSPSPLAAELSRHAGGPKLPIVISASAAIAVCVASAIVWLAALGVRERRLLETRPLLETPRLRLGVLAGRAVALWIATMLAFALFESYVHWRAGLGWHGLHCLVGPAHRDAVPILGALSLVAAAAVSALEHVFAWMRRLLALIKRRPAATAFLRPDRRPRAFPRPAILAGGLGARAPPLF